MEDTFTFTLTIDLGNDAMRDAFDVAEALGRVAARLRRGQTAGKVMDVNGNTVGEFSMPETGIE